MDRFVPGRIAGADRRSWTVMDIDFLGQPLTQKDQLGRMLEDALADAQSFWALAAWAQVSGLEQLGDAIRGVRKRGGESLAVVGIDGGIATREGLELALDLFDPAYVFHDTGNRLFHPKVFCVEGAAEILVSVGSSNLTGRGLFRNYEANLVVRLTRGDEQDEELYERLVAYREALTASEMPCERLDTALIDRLSEEESLVAPQRGRETSKRTREAKAESLAKEIFGKPVSGLARSPRSRGSASRRRHGAPRASPASSASVAFRWSKRLERSDVLRKPESSHQRNYVILGKAGHAIDQKTWFREELFGSLDWTDVPMRGGKNTKEQVIVPFQVFVDDQPVAEYELRIDHSEGRIANQNNSPTYLNWSSMLALIRADDYTDWWLELARRSDDTFELRLLREEPQIS